ncbi:MAG: hypothetical protein ACOCZH_04370 [Phototrophicaceae bacterium]
MAEINERLLDAGIIGGYAVEQDYPELKDHMLLCVTEANSRAEIDMLAATLREVK